MNNKKILLFVLLLCGIVFISGCEKEEEKKELTIVGKWAQGSYVYTFNEDKTCTYEVSGQELKCTYETEGMKLSILYEGNTDPFTTVYSIEGNKINIKDSFGNDTIYERQ